MSRGMLGAGHGQKEPNLGTDTGSADHRVEGIRLGLDCHLNARKALLQPLLVGLWQPHSVHKYLCNFHTLVQGILHQPSGCIMG